MDYGAITVAAIASAGVVASALIQRRTTSEAHRREDAARRDERDRETLLRAEEREDAAKQRAEARAADRQAAAEAQEAERARHATAAQAEDRERRRQAYAHFTSATELVLQTLKRPRQAHANLENTVPHERWDDLSRAVAEVIEAFDVGTGLSARQVADDLRALLPYQGGPPHVFLEFELSLVKFAQQARAEP